MTSSARCRQCAQEARHAFEQPPRFLLRIEPRGRRQVRALLDQVGHQPRDFRQPHVRQRAPPAPKLATAALSRSTNGWYGSPRSEAWQAPTSTVQRGVGRSSRAGWPSSQPQQLFDQARLADAFLAVDGDDLAAPGGRVLGGRQQLGQRRLAADERKRRLARCGDGSSWRWRRLARVDRGAIACGSLAARISRYSRCVVGSG